MAETVLEGGSFAESLLKISMTYFIYDIWDGAFLNNNSDINNNSAPKFENSRAF